MLIDRPASDCETDRGVVRGVLYKQRSASLFLGWKKWFSANGKEEQKPVIIITTVALDRVCVRVQVWRRHVRRFRVRACLAGASSSSKCSDIHSCSLLLLSFVSLLHGAWSVWFLKKLAFVTQQVYVLYSTVKSHPSRSEYIGLALFRRWSWQTYLAGYWSKYQWTTLPCRSSIRCGRCLCELGAHH